MDGERQRRSFTRAHQLPEFGEEREHRRLRKFLGPENARSQRVIDLLLLVRQHDLGEHIRRHHEREAGQLPKEVKAPGVRQVDQDVRICDDGPRGSNPPALIRQG
jgi:hypothetical protein